jgi:hypothetical protein
LRDLIAATSGLRVEASGALPLAQATAASTIFGGRRSELAGKSIRVTTKAQFKFVYALIDLDGLAARLSSLPRPPRRCSRR